MSHLRTPFTVLAAGSPTLTYRWLFNGVSILGATNSTLGISNAQPINGPHDALGGCTNVALATIAVMCADPGLRGLARR